jgi:hypothetical protein
MTATATERLARNEALFREVNERIRNVAGGHDGDTYDFVCECADPACTARVSLTIDQYEHVRANSVRFVLAVGHVRTDIEHVVEHAGDHLVVAKSGAAARVARDLDPRTAGR